MKKISAQSLSLALALAVLAPLVQAATTVEFVKPQSGYRDIVRDGHDESQTLDLLKDHIVKQAEKSVPAGASLDIKITDVDLAGDQMRRASMTRDVVVARDIDWPAISLSYTLKNAAGELLMQKDTVVKDMSYLQHSNRYPSDDFLRYEKRMLDTWLASGLKTAKKKAAAASSSK